MHRRGLKQRCRESGEGKQENAKSEDGIEDMRIHG
jgi:hypothetical protein